MNADTLLALKVFALPYMLIPAAGAALAGWVVGNWKVAAMTLAGVLVYMVVVRAFMGTALVYPLPVLAGVGIGCLAILPLLLIWPGAARWTRVTVAAIATMVPGAWLILSNPGVV